VRFIKDSSCRALSCFLAFKNPYFSSQWNGATNAGLIRGAYHFGLPHHASGAAQANWFVSNGGRWTADEKTLPGVLDIECMDHIFNHSDILTDRPIVNRTVNPSGPTCYGLTPTAIVHWIHDFSNTYRSKVGRYPVVYTNTNWWKQCTGNSGAFASTNPLWIAHYASSVGPLPGGWKHYTFWQYSDHGPVPGDQDYYNGDLAGLKKSVAFSLLGKK
jgi:GH25 family lysozyme M1 (1,4-beta-N-acetylmuramidase)